MSTHPNRSRKQRTYIIRFLAKRGCERGIIDDMARFDASEVVALGPETVPDNGWGARHASVKLRTRFPVPRDWEPTMRRWASFAVGAQYELVEEPAG